MDNKQSFFYSHIILLVHNSIKLFFNYTTFIKLKTLKNKDILF